MAKLKRMGLDKKGFTVVEVVIATLITPILIIAISNALVTLRQTYGSARQINDILAVVTTYPELDRGLRYESLEDVTNFTPSIDIDNEGGGTLTYIPTITVQNSSGVSETSAIPDSKVVDVTANYTLRDNTTIPIKMRLLITRNGIGQL